MIRAGIHMAETDEEKLAVYRFRYDVYVEEMGRYGGVADHAKRLLIEPERNLPTTLRHLGSGISEHLLTVWPRLAG